MKKMEFYKLQASGNDFILIDSLKLRIRNSADFYKNFSRQHCLRKLEIGADGLLVIEPSRKASFKMRIFNPDGSEAEMCGNGARCVGLWADITGEQAAGTVKFETKAGIIAARVKKQSHKIKNCKEVRIKMTDPFDLDLNFPLKVLGRSIKVNFINSGVPHAIILVEGLDKIDVDRIGRAIRFHKRFEPAGTNVNFVEFKKDNFIKIRTYERGIEAETLACGTGCVASAIISSCILKPSVLRRGEVVKVGVKSQEKLKVYFNREDKISDVWLEGTACLVYKGIAQSA